VSEFAAELRSLRDSASSADDVAAQAARLRLGQSLEGLAGALRGGRSVAAAQRLGTAWTTRTDAWGTDVGAYADGLRRTAAGYAASDEAARAAFDGPILGRLPIVGGLLG
jgi:hypothetical protein